MNVTTTYKTMSSADFSFKQKSWCFSWYDLSWKNSRMCGQDQHRELVPHQFSMNNLRVLLFPIYSFSMIKCSNAKFLTTLITNEAVNDKSRCSRFKTWLNYIVIFFANHCISQVFVSNPGITTCQFFSTSHAVNLHLVKIRNQFLITGMIAFRRHMIKSNFNLFKLDLSACNNIKIRCFLFI